MNYHWDFILQFLFIAILLGVGLFLKSTFKLFKKHLIPISILAGFLGLLLGPEILKVLPFDIKVLEEFVYHAMSLGFIALALKKRTTKNNSKIVKTAFYIVNTYAIQAIVGFGVSLILAYTIFPDLFPISGFLLPLGFAQGPGQAISTATTWEQYGFLNGGNVGLSVATLGFLWALIGGIPLMNILIKKSKRLPKPEKADMAVAASPSVDIENKTSKVKGIYLDELAMQVILIGFVYFITYLLMSGLTILIKPLGGLGDTMAGLLWGFSFLWCAVVAILVRKIINIFTDKGLVKNDIVDNYTMQRISNTLFDFMIVAAISAISISVFKDYWAPIIIITTVGGLATMAYVLIYTKWVYQEHVLENIVMLYGTWTGTVTTGMALLREVDPEGKSGVAEIYVLGSGLGAAFGFILMMILNLPTYAVAYDKPIFYLYTFIALILYAVAMTTGIALTLRKERKKK